MAHQVVQVILRCESAAETEHLGNKTMPIFFFMKIVKKTTAINKKINFICDSITEYKACVHCTLKSVDD